MVRRVGKAKGRKSFPFQFVRACRRRRCFAVEISRRRRHFSGNADGLEECQFPFSFRSTQENMQKGVSMWIKGSNEHASAASLREEKSMKRSSFFSAAEEEQASRRSFLVGSRSATPLDVVRFPLVSMLTTLSFEPKTLRQLAERPSDGLLRLLQSRKVENKSAVLRKRSDGAAAHERCGQARDQGVRMLDCGVRLREFDVVSHASKREK